MDRRLQHRLTTLTAAAIAPVLAFTLCGCGGSAGDGSSDSTAGPAHGPLFKMDRALRIGVKTDQPGIGLADATGGNNTGLDIDIGREIAAALEDEPVFQSVVSQNREVMITSGAVDLVIASYSITEARLELLDFAGPYLIAGQDILVRQTDASAYTGVESLHDKKVCILEASTGYRHLQDHYSENWAKQHLVTRYEGKPILGYKMCVEMLLRGEVDAVSTDDAALAGYANQQQHQGLLHLVGNRFSLEKYGIALAKGNPADVELINVTLRRMIQDGRWEAIIRKNLGAAAPVFLRPENIPKVPVTP